MLGRMCFALFDHGELIYSKFCIYLNSYLAFRQRMNHFPRSFMITKKDILYESIDRAMVQYGSCYDFVI